MTDKQQAKPSAPSGDAPAAQRFENTVDDVDSKARANEDPRDRARRLGQGDDIDPSIPTNQTPEQLATDIPAANSNEELRIAGDKRAVADDDATRGQGNDQRGQTQRG